MILKKEHISSGKIHCYLSLNNKISKVIIGNKTHEMDLSSIKEIESSNEYDIVTNFLLRINKLLSNLKNQDENFINSEITIIVDNKTVERIIKPEGFIIKKPSKDFKKSVDNQRLKAMLGITLQELSNFKNIDLIFENFSKEEETNMNNNSNEFNYSKEDDNFEINMDISGLNDIMNVSDIDSLNYDENDLFKEFDLNTESLFTENNTDTFVFENKEISIPEDNFEANENSFNNIDTRGEESFEFVYSNDFEDEAQSNENSIFGDESFNISDDFIIGDNNDFTEENFMFDLGENSKDNIITKDSNTEEIVYPIEEEIVYSTKEDTTSLHKEEVVYPIEEEIIYSSKEEIVYPDEVDTTSLPKEEEIVYPIEEDSISLPKEEVVYSAEETVVHPIKEHRQDNPEFKTPESSSLKIEKASENLVETYTHTEIKEDTVMNENNVEYNKTLDINDEFIQNELVELKNLLKSKAASYRNRFNQMNAKYEEKHLALKDLTLTDEKEQLKIFKEFLTCKSTMISLKALDDTCTSIISDIEDKMFNIKK